MKKQITIEQNEYAKDKFDNHVYILDVEKGQKGYWCLGCGNEMQAVHGTVEHRKKYFRHVAKDVNIERKCAFSNEEYRHKLAIEILQFTKRIKVPNLYFYSPDGRTKVLLEEAKYIEADHVKAELTFYENDECEVKWGKNPDIKERNLLVRPDLTFFNSKDEPILLLEIVVSHKINDEKRIKLKRLGIDTIQIKIPKDSEENIKKSLETSINTKWVYNYEQERTDFIHVSNRTREEVSPLDEEQRKLLGETYECRKNELSNVIRTITKCLDGQRYRDNVYQLEQELSRVKRNTTEFRERHDQLRNTIRERVRKRFGDSLDSLEREEKEFEERTLEENRKLQNEFDSVKTEQESYYRGVERRYLYKRETLSKSERDIREETKRIGESIKSNESIRGRYGSVRESTINLQRDIEGIQRRRKSLENEFESDRKRIESRFKQLTTDEQSVYKEHYRSIRSRIDSLREEFAAKESRVAKYFHNQERILDEQIETEEKSIEDNTERIRNRIIRFMEGENSDGSIKLPERITKLFEARRILRNWEEEYSTCARYRIALDCIRKGDYKNWKN